MEYAIHLIIEYLPYCANLRLVCKSWCKQLEYNDNEIGNTIWKIHYSSIRTLNETLRLKTIFHRAISKGDVQSIRSLLCMRSVPIRFLKWRPMISTVNNQEIAEILIMYIQEYSMWKSPIFSLLAISIEKEYNSIIRRYIPYYNNNLYYIFARLNTVSNEIRNLFKELNIDISWYIYYLDINVDDIPSNLHDPWLPFVRESIRTGNNVIVKSILDKRSYEFGHLCLHKDEIIRLARSYNMDI